MLIKLLYKHNFLFSIGLKHSKGAYNISFDIEAIFHMTHEHYGPRKYWIEQTIYMTNKTKM